jgi:hypothetical protein
MDMGADRQGMFLACGYPNLQSWGYNGIVRRLNRTAAFVAPTAFRLDGRWFPMRFVAEVNVVAFGPLCVCCVFHSGACTC